MLLRTLIATAASFMLVFLLMPKFIEYLKKLSFKQTISEYSLDEFKEKAGTPIMGGILFIVVPVIVTLVCVGRTYFNLDIFIVLFTFVGYGLIGFTDDYLIAVKKTNDGLSPRNKFLMQIVVALVVYALYHRYADLSISFLFVHYRLYLGIFYAVLILFMFAGASNAVNLTDGMDGLAAGCMIAPLLAFGVFAWLQEKVGVVIFIGALIGALMAYLYYNVKPAKVFMGDTGSLALGAVLAALAMVLKEELSLIFIGGVFVIETLCVIIQIGSVKIRKKRVFLYTPIHYAYVMKGMQETQVIQRFWYLSCVFAVIGLILGLIY